jgi:hypothetical protein
MADDEQFESGVAAVFDAIASDPPAEPSKPAPAKRPKNTPSPSAKTTPPNDQPPAQRPVARTGRFPGAKNGPRKEKVTARISPDLRNAFVEWALDDRCAIQELFERALTEFYQRHRATLDNNK